MKRIREVEALRKAAVCLLSFLLVFGSGAASARAGEETHVVILATSDMHGNIWGWSYEDEKETENNGMARLYTYIQQVRAEYPDTTFLIDGGDVIQGTVLSDQIAAANPEEPNPMIAAMNYMGYDCMTLGNHEFDRGVPAMEKALSTADFPVLGQNVRGGDGKLLTGKGWILLERGGIRLAVIGVCTPYLALGNEEQEGVAEVKCEAASAAVAEALKEIGDRADVIMVSAHMGFHPQYDEDGGSDSGERILEDNPEVDVLQVGHMHVTVQEKRGRTVIGGVRNAGREIARFDLTLDGNGKITASEVTIVDMADYAPAEEIREIPVVKEMHEKAVALVQGGAGEDGDSGPVIGSSTAKFQPENEIDGLPEGKIRDTAVPDLIMKIQLLSSGADVTAASLFQNTSDLPTGDITFRDVMGIYKYDNVLYRVSVTGKELREYMEWSAGCYNQWVPGDINISFDPEVPDYLQDFFAGVEYEINLSKPKGERIENVRFRGEELRDDQTLTLAVNNYRYASVLKEQGIIAGKRDWESSGAVRDMIADWIRENSPITPETDNNWKITGVDLNEGDPRREQLIQWINEGRLPVPYHESYNLADYEELAKQAGGAE